jgi:hypothetical protein
MRIATTTVVTLWLAVGLACSYAWASGPSINDKDLNLTLTLPDGFEPVLKFPSLPGGRTRYVYKRPNPDGKSAVIVGIQQLKGTLKCERVDTEQAREKGADRAYQEKWKSFEINIIVAKVMQAESTTITRTAQIPIDPCAVQLVVLGPESQDAELAEMTRTLLASLDGPSSWLTKEQSDKAFSEGLAEIVLLGVAIWAVVYNLARWRTKVFREKVIAMGHPVAWANQNIRPSWVWYLLPAYLFYAAVLVSTFMYMGAFEDFGLHAPPGWPTVIGNCTAQLLTLIIGGIILWRRVKCKRRVLAHPLSAASPLPPSPLPIPGSLERS